MASGSSSWPPWATHRSSPRPWPKPLGVTEQSGKDLAETVAEWLASRQLLLVLDNAEHLLEACAQLADVLLRRCAGLSLLVTSRERLGIDGELTYRVPSLSVPEARQDATSEEVLACEAARLFIDRARLQRPDFDGDGEGCRGAGVDLPPPGRHRAGHRAGGAAGARDVDGGAEPAARRPLRRADRRLAHGTAASPHAALADRLEPRPAGRCREGGAAACLGVCRRLDAGSRRVRVQRRGRRPQPRCWTC